MGQVEFGFEGCEDAGSQGLVFDERSIEAGYAEVGFGEGHFYVADDVDEEGKVAHHGLEEGEAIGCGLDEVVESVAYAEPCGNKLAGLHPAEDPGDGAEVGHGFFAAALGGARADAGVFEFGYGSGLLEVSEGVGIVDDVFAVEVVRGGGELFECGLPCGGDFAGEVGCRNRRSLHFAALRSG